MKSFALKPLFAAVLLAGAATAAQAARLDVVSYDAPSSLYSGLFGSSLFNDVGTDISAGSDIGAVGTAVIDNGTTVHGYAADAFFLSGSLVSVSAGQFYDSSAQSVYFGSAIATLPSITLQVVAEAGDAGSIINIDFAGLAQTVQQGTASGVAMDFAVYKGSTLVGNYQSNAVGADTPISFAFQAQAGDVLTLSASVATNLSAIGQASSFITGRLDGEFTVTAVPEPEQYALFLAGLGLMGAIARRRTSR